MTNEQLAELLVGIAKSQQAIIDSVAHHLGNDAGRSFKSMSVIPTLQGAAGLHNRGAQPTFGDLPSRLLLQLQGGPQAGRPPIQEWLAQELARLTA